METKILAELIYLRLVGHHKGKEQGISMKDLSKIYQVSERQVRKAVKFIRDNSNFTYVIQGDVNGYYVVVRMSELDARKRVLVKSIRDSVKEIQKIDRFLLSNNHGTFIDDTTIAYIKKLENDRRN